MLMNNNNVIPGVSTNRQMTTGDNVHGARACHRRSSERISNVGVQQRGVKHAIDLSLANSNVMHNNSTDSNKITDLSIQKRWAYVTHVVDPWNFFTRLGTLDELESYSEFDKRVNKVGRALMKTGTELHKLPPLVHGQIVIARSVCDEQEQWIRGVVLKSTESDENGIVPQSAPEIDLFFADHGPTNFVERSDIVTNIPDEILNHPHLVSSCRLANIRPNERDGEKEEWSEECVAYFSKNVLRKRSQADIIPVDVDIFGGREDLVHLVIYPQQDNHSKTNIDISINQFLVAYKLAVSDHTDSAEGAFKNHLVHLNAMTIPSRDLMGIGRGSRSLTSSSAAEPKISPRGGLSVNDKSSKQNAAVKDVRKGLPPPDLGFLSPRPTLALENAKKPSPQQKDKFRRHDIANGDLESMEFINYLGGEDVQEFETRSDARITRYPEEYFKVPAAPSAAIDMNRENSFRYLHDPPSKTVGANVPNVRGKSFQRESPDENNLPDNWQPRNDARENTDARKLLRNVTKNDASEKTDKREECGGGLKKLNNENETDYSFHYETIIRSPYRTDDEILSDLFEQIGRGNENCLRERREPNELAVCLDALMKVAVNGHVEKLSFHFDDDSRIEERVIEMICAFADDCDFEQIIENLVHGYYDKLVSINSGAKALEADRRAEEQELFRRRINSLCIILAELFLAARRRHDVSVHGIVYKMMNTWSKGLQPIEGELNGNRTFFSVSELSAMFLTIFLQTIAETSIDVVYENFDDVIEDVRNLLTSQNCVRESVKDMILKFLLNFQTIKVSQNYHGKFVTTAASPPVGQNSLIVGGRATHKVESSSSMQTSSSEKYRTPNASVDSSDMENLRPNRGTNSELDAAATTNTHSVVHQRLLETLRRGMKLAETKDDVNLFAYRHENPEDYPVPIATHRLEKKAENGDLESSDVSPRDRPKKKKKRAVTSLGVFMRATGNGPMLPGCLKARIGSGESDEQTSDFGTTQFCTICGETTHKATDCDERDTQDKFF